MVLFGRCADVAFLVRVVRGRLGHAGHVVMALTAVTAGGMAAFEASSLKASLMRDISASTASASLVASESLMVDANAIRVRSAQGVELLGLRKLKGLVTEVFRHRHPLQPAAAAGGPVVAPRGRGAGTPKEKPCAGGGAAGAGGGSGASEASKLGLQIRAPNLGSNKSGAQF